MQRRVAAYLSFAVLFAPLPCAAANLPGIKTSPSNRVPECATPGRMTRYLKSRNPELDPRFAGVATEYMRLGEALEVRWDFAFYQMIIETGSLSYRRGNRSGDVKASQNNFAGLGAIGGGATGESFKDIATGVRAHLEHLLLYAGDKLDNPTAERTRKVQEWGVLTAWHKRFTRPITFTDLAQQWAPGSGSYGKMLEDIADRFAEFCAAPDPHPELVAEAHGHTIRDADPTSPAEASARPVGTELAKRAIEDGKAQDNDRRSALGALEPEKPLPAPFTLLNPPPAAPEADRAMPTPSEATSYESPAKAKEPAIRATATSASPLAPAGAAKATANDKGLRTAAAGTAAKASPQPPQPTGQKCRVWTASYGGQKALIIRSIVDKVVNYTVLDVNDGAETREAEAFIQAYAKDGAVTGEFGSQTQALDKAFELCPEG
jgi:Mannosyl-glycoprotein endo-beta-N-acetylglucosaminidase